MSRRRAKSAISRRAFLKGAVLTGAVATASGLVPSAPQADVANQGAAEGVIERLGPGPVNMRLKVNGDEHELTVEPRVTLLRALREHLGLTGTKLVCDRGACGACTVHLDGKPVTACMMLAVDARGHEITTIEGVALHERVHLLQPAFVRNDALQCGFCTPGMVMSVAAALKRNPSATIDEIKTATAGNICRCGTYPHVFHAGLESTYSGGRSGA